MPAYNEEKRIGGTLEFYSKFFEEKRKRERLDYEILIVINNTIDKTEEIVKKYCMKNKHINYLNFKQGGKGFAIIEGFRDALKRKNEFIGFVDADLATSPAAFYDLVKNIGPYDGIMASRYIRGASVKPKQSMQRIIASRTFNLLIRTLFFMRYRDTQCGAKLFKRKTIEKILPHLIITKWAFDVDLLYRLKKNELIIKEFPTIWGDKEYSKINLKKAGPLMALALIRLRILNSPFKDFIRLYDNFLKLFGNKK